MFEAILFDLDGTLITFDPNEFIKTYLSAAAEFFSDLITAPKQFAEEVLKSTFAIEVADSDETTVTEDFFADFCPKYYEVNCKVIKERFEEFYQKRFDVVKPLIKPAEGAVELITTLRKDYPNIKLVLATNPVFPEIAIEKRMIWGGLKKEWFDWITHSDNSHYAKGNLKYWDEILSNIKVEPAKALVVGNDVKRDLMAKKRGLKTFLVEDTIENGDHLTPDIYPNYKGKLKDVLQILT